MKIAIIAALNEEIKLFRKMESNKIYLAVCGVGKVNAAAKTQAVIDKFKPDLVIMVGVAAAADPKLKIGEVIVAKDLIQWDVDATAFSKHLPGQILFSQLRLFKAAELFVKKLAKNSGVIVGRIVSGDTFVANKKLVKKIYRQFQDQAIDMESAALAQVCQINQTPFLVIKAISDQADGQAKVDFKKFLAKASQNNYDLVNRILLNLILNSALS